MSERFLVWGAGGHGKVVADLVREAGHEVAGFADRDPVKEGEAVEPGGARVVLSEGSLLLLLTGHDAMPCGATAIALAVGENAARLRCLERLGAVPAPPLVHPRASVSRAARLGRGTVVFAGAVVNADAVLHEAVIVNSGAVVEHDCDVAAGAHIAPGAVLTGGVRVGRRALVGARAVVTPNVVVGDDALVGAGAVVVRDVPDGATVAGVPARTLRKRDR